MTTFGNFSGTVAAAATVLMFVPSCKAIAPKERKKVRFICDRPFLYALIIDQGANRDVAPLILFLGCVRDPSIWWPKMQEYKVLWPSTAQLFIEPDMDYLASVSKCWMLLIWTIYKERMMPLAAMSGKCNHVNYWKTFGRLLCKRFWLKDKKNAFIMARY